MMYPSLMIENKFMEVFCWEFGILFFKLQEKYLSVYVLNCVTLIIINMYYDIGRISVFVKYCIILLIACMNWKIRLNRKREPSHFSPQQFTGWKPIITMSNTVIYKMIFNE